MGPAVAAAAVAVWSAGLADAAEGAVGAAIGWGAVVAGGLAAEVAPVAVAGDVVPAGDVVAADVVAADVALVAAAPAVGGDAGAPGAATAATAAASWSAVDACEGDDPWVDEDASALSAPGWPDAGDGADAVALAATCAAAEPPAGWTGPALAACAVAAATMLAASVAAVVGWSV
jgi:hypothetical protein